MTAMRYRPLGTSGLTVSEVSIGTWAIGGEHWGEVNDEDSIAAIRRAIDLGATFIDTADIYGKGHAEEIVGKAIAGRRHEVIIATKVANRWNEKGERWTDCSYDYIMQAVQASLKRLGTGYIDVYLIHKPDPETPAEETMRALEKLYQDGVIRAFGVSRYNLDQLAEAQSCLPLHVVQYPLNMFRRKEITPLLPFCREHNIGVMAYAPLSKGLLTGKFSVDTQFPDNDMRSRSAGFSGDLFRKRLDAVEQLKPIAAKYGKTLAQLAINWNLCQPGVTTALVGVKRPAQVEENAGGSGWAIEPDDLAVIERITGGLTDMEQG